MPVGTSFENSSMKASFSLSSLSQQVTPDRAVKPRMYNSLTKNRNETKMWRRSWGSSASEHKDDFWSALQANYNYIMDNQLIDNCQEARSELNNEMVIWSIKECYTQFSELYSLLNSVQEAIYGKEENIIDKSLRARYMTTVLQKSSNLKLFNEQTSQLMKLNPELQEEIAWRVNHLNAKWDSVLGILGPSECIRCDQEACLDIDHEIKCLRKWIRNMEACLQPLDFRAKFTKTEIEAKALELSVLHSDIENHGKIVNSVVKLCKRTDATCNIVNARRLANVLEKRWHLLFLRSLEWQCYIESLSKRETYRSQISSSGNSDSELEEPVHKYPRLSNRSNEQFSSDDSSAFEDECSDPSQKNDCMLMNDSHSVMLHNRLKNENKQNRNNDVPLMFTEVTSDFTQSNRKAPNLGTYYFKHQDTDSEMDKKEPPKEDHTDETSEDEWVYSKMDEGIQTNEQDKFVASKSLMQDIRRLVQEAEELVSPDKNKTLGTPLNKISRVKQWLNINKPEDSCDASGEDDEQESHSSEDLNESITTCRATQFLNSSNTSFIDLNKTLDAPKIQLRTQQRYNLKGSRPWSVSCISQLSQNSCSRINTSPPTLSISESALHELALTPKAMNNFDGSNSGVHCNNSTSSTVEESAVLLDDKSSPTRRKRLKLKKKSYIRKIECHVPYYPSLQKQFGALTKSGSFSGCSNKIANNERHTSSDPSAMIFGNYCNYETSTTSGADSDDEKYKQRLPQFKVGLNNGSDVRDSGINKCILQASEEQSSSLSEQAWDNYQEKYLSETYSEAHDSDAARRLLEFGEDYRNFLDSQSDWSQSTNPELSPPFKRKVVQLYKNYDSDSDAEYIKQLLKESRDQLEYTSDVYEKQFRLGLKDYLIANEITEMVSTCDRHVNLLNVIEQSPEEYSLMKSDKKETTELLLHWQNLRGRVLKMQDYRDLQKEILLLKSAIKNVKIAAPLDSLAITTVQDLSRDVDFYNAELADMNEYKKKLLPLNVAVHRFTTENKDYNASSLKADISELYGIWYEHYGSAQERITQMTNLLQKWQMLENRLEQLQGDLREDEQTLVFLDTALQGGTFSNQMATSVRDVAKLLAETKSTGQGCGIPELFSEGGSLSDSGISDEGSEHELGERERRLAAIRRLVRLLELVISPDCAARARMTEKLKAAEEELHSLQKKCRSLIVRTAVCVASEAAAPTAPTSDRNNGNISGVIAGDPDNDPSPGTSGSSWFRRVIRASLPFHLAIVALLCVACLLEPHCCDNMNNFSFSFTPQLRYVRGPPPV